MEEKKKFPSLPPNYVTLQQLQERRLKEQEQKRKEKVEEEEQRRKFLQEQEVAREKEEEERKLHETQRAQAIEAKASCRSIQRNPRNLSERKRLIEEEIGTEVQKGGGGGVAIGITADGGGFSDEGQKPEESKQKKRSRNRKKSKKTMFRRTQAESEFEAKAGVPKQSQAENRHEGNQIPVEPKKENKGWMMKEGKMEPPMMKEEEASTGIVEERGLQNGNGHEERNAVACGKRHVRMQRIHNGIHQGSKGTADEKAARASGVKKDSVNVTVTEAEIRRKVGDLALAHNHEHKEKNNRGGSLTLRIGSGSGSGSHRGGSQSRRGQYHQRRSSDHGRNTTRNRDGNLMWVKKEEIIPNENEIQEGKIKAKAVCDS